MEPKVRISSLVALLACALAWVAVSSCGSSSSSNNNLTPDAGSDAGAHGELTLWVVPDDATPLTTAQIADFQAGKLYYNAHTAANPNGEIRGQLDHQGTAKLAALDASQEGLSTTTFPAFGGGILAVDTDGKAAGFIITTGLSNKTNAHVHDDVRGTPGPVILPLTGPTPGTPGDSDLWVVPDNGSITTAQLADFNAGRLYYNAHTQTNPNGEIRGQLEKGGTLKLASMNGAQETPPTSSTAIGAGILAVDTSNDDVAGFMVTAGLTNPTIAHVHDGPRGVGAGVIVPLKFATSAAPNIGIVPDGQGPLSAAQVTDFGAGNLYYNAHTSANQNGEIRGQLDTSGSAVVKFASLDFPQETGATAPAVLPYGAGILAVDTTTGKVSGFMITSGLISPTVAHVHDAARGTPGSVIIPLTKATIRTLP